jgi:arylsulfatase A-like enzyme
MLRLTRRDFIRDTAAGALIGGGAFAGQSGVRRPGGRKPNIIFILADDLGYGDLGCYGQTKFQTTNIDRLASEGMRFSDFYAGSTVCAPSRCALMTGYHMGHAYIRGNSSTVGRVALRPEDVTVAELLKSAGYKTGAFGKWGLGLEGTTGHPNRQGFDQWYGYLDQTHAHFYYTDHLWRNETRTAIDPTHYSHDLIFDASLDFIRQNAAQPFFLYLAATIPHASMEVPEDSLAKYRGRFPETPFPGAHYSKQPVPNAALAAMIDRLDRDVGRLLALLQELGIDGETIVFFSSDNGPHKEGGRDPQFFASSGPLRGIKRDLYDGGIRVPFLARWPGSIKPGVVSGRCGAFWDFLPTACALADMGVPEGLDGISILPTLRGSEQPPHKYLYWEFFERKFQQAARMGRWKAVRLGPGQPLELYDLSADLAESTDLAGKNPEVTAQMERILREARTESELWPVKP